MSDICSGKAINLYCPLTQVPLALGNEGSEFDEHPIVYEALLMLEDLALRGGILCQCGHEEMDVELYPDRLELVCTRCHGRLTIAAADEGDLADLKAVERIRMGQEGHHRSFHKE
jgi:hypothetical protein